MVTALRLTIAASAGMMFYLAIAFTVAPLPIRARQRIGDFYLSLAARSLKQFAIVRRQLGGFDIYPLSVDDEQKLAKVTLSSSTLGSDKELPFRDPDNRIKRLCNKPLAIVPEGIPAAVDATVSEWGYWVREQDIERGYHTGEEGERVAPYARMRSGLRLVDPMDALPLVSKNVKAENIKTAEELTKKRYEKYGGRIGMAETVGTIMGFVAGVGGVASLRYVNEEILDGAGGGGGLPEGPGVPMGLMDPAPVVDVLVTVL